MKLWINRARCKYGSAGGLIVVAANTQEEAHLLLKTGDEFEPYYKEYYHFENWKCVDDVVVNVDIPCIIDEDSHVE